MSAQFDACIKLFGMMVATLDAAGIADRGEMAEGVRAMAADANSEAERDILFSIASALLVPGKPTFRVLKGGKQPDEPEPA